MGSLTIWNISNQCIKEEGPAKRVQQRFFELVELEMLVADTLSIHSDSLERQDAVFFAEPTAIQLVVWDSPEKKDADGGSEQSRDKKYNLPWLDCCAVLAATDRNAVG